MTLPVAQVERRHSPRFALQLNASLREPGKSRVSVRIIDISVAGCRIEQLCGHSFAPFAWIYVGDIGNGIYARVRWFCDRFAGLEFAEPLHEAVLGNLLASQHHMTDQEVGELRAIARRARNLIGRAKHADTSRELVDLTRDCAIAAIVQGLENHVSSRIGQRVDW